MAEEIDQKFQIQRNSWVRRQYMQYSCNAWSLKCFVYMKQSLNWMIREAFSEMNTTLVNYTWGLDSLIIYHSQSKR